MLDPPKSSTYRELAAVLFALRSKEIGDRLAGQRCTFLLDSTAAVANLANGGGPVAELTELAKLIWIECVAKGIDASPHWVRRDRNTYADFLSRQSDRADWVISQSALEEIKLVFGTPSIDRFASSRNSVCKRFNSRFFDPRAEATDAFTQHWGDELKFCNPDFNQIHKVIVHARACAAQVILVFPHWTNTSWWSEVAEAPNRIVLGYAKDVLAPGPRSTILEPQIPNWVIGAALLDFSLPTLSSFFSPTGQNSF